jgi:Flp pilus assembly protein protease CpaA
MKKSEARSIHAHFDAAARLTVVLPVMAMMTVVAMGWGFADSLALFAAALCFTGVVTAVSVDTISKRIPNSLSLAVFLSGPIWWVAMTAGSDITKVIADGVVMNVMGKVYGIENLDGAVIPLLGGVEYPLRILLDMAMMVLVFIPLLLSFALGMGFGGGDVKLMTGASLFFGWPLAMDFFFLSFLIGGIFSVVVILGRISSKYAIRSGVESERLLKMSKVREFAFAPAIGIAAVICFAIKLQGFN